MLLCSAVLCCAQAAKQGKKWLLVNIQADSEFDCHRLNRDLWKDEMVKEVIKYSCVFWQVRFGDVTCVLVCGARGSGRSF